MSPESASQRGAWLGKFLEEFFVANPRFQPYMNDQSKMYGKPFFFETHWYKHASGLEYRGSFGGRVEGFETMEVFDLTDTYTPRVILSVSNRTFLAFPLNFIGWEPIGGWQVRLQSDPQFEIRGTLSF